MCLRFSPEVKIGCDVQQNQVTRLSCLFWECNSNGEYVALRLFSYRFLGNENILSVLNRLEVSGTE